MQRERLETFKIMIKERYSIGEVIGIKPFTPIYPKFKDPSSFFSVVGLVEGCFFVKRYHTSQTERARNDVEESNLLFNQYISSNTSIIENNKMKFLTEFNSDIFTVAFIDGVDLRTEQEVYGLEIIMRNFFNYIHLQILNSRNLAITEIISSGIDTFSLWIICKKTRKGGSRLVNYL